MEQRIVELTEQELIQTLNEVLGSNMDVNTLSDFIFNFLENKEMGQYTLTTNQLPKLRKIKINKIIINYTHQKQPSYFDIKKSQITNNGAVLYFNFNKNDISDDIYHEVNHALQFFVLGKERTANKLRPIEASKYSRRFIKNNKDIIDIFIDILDKSTESEINSQISGVYGKLMTHLKKQGWKKGMFSNDDNFPKWFTDYIKSTNSYNESKKMINYDVFKEFDINTLNGVEEYDKRVFFTVMEESGNYIIRLNLMDKIKYLWNYWKLISTDRLDIGYNILTSEQVNSLMKKYQMFINKQGEKLRRKLFRLYDLFL